MMNIKSIINKVNSLLIKKYGIPSRNVKIPDPLDILIGTILSQNTNDKNSFKAYTDLKKKYSNWKDVENLTPTQIEKIIKVAGLGKQKSNAIKKVLTYLKNVKGELSLNYLKNFNDEEILNELTQFDGVGLKTASCVLLFSLRRNSCPVDTHVNRTLNRIGIANTSNPEKTFKLINSQMPEGIAHQFHTNLIRLGREICKPTNPNCLICPLQKVCLFENKNFECKSDYKVNDFLLLDSIT
jgi:endonuclease-3